MPWHFIGFTLVIVQTPGMGNSFLHWLHYIHKHPWITVFEVVSVVLVLAGGLRHWNSPVVILAIDGKTLTLHPRKIPTVRDLLQQQKIILKPMDLCYPPLDTPLGHQLSIKVTRVDKVIEKRITKETPMITELTHLKPNLRHVLVQKGTQNEIHEDVEITRHDGQPVTEKVLKSKTIKKPVYTLTLYDEKTGLPAEMYDLVKSKKLIMRATGYYIGEKTVPSTITFLGHKLRRGLVAIDPKVIPLRSRLYVKGYGYAYASDTGGAIHGLRIDLAVKDKYEEAKFNRHNVPVYILEKASSW